MTQKKWLLVLLLTLVGGNLIWLNFQVLNLSPNENKVNTSVEPLFPTDINVTAEDEYITKQELDISLQVATASVTKQIEVLSKATGKEVTQVIESKQLQSSVKEYYIPLGTGSTSSQDWVDISGAEAYLVPSNYGTITAVYFEAAIKIPTGNGQVLARLRNVTDNVSLFESEISQKDTQTGLISSGFIPPPTTTKLYRIQLRSTLGALVVIDNARIKLFVR